MRVAAAKVAHLRTWQFPEMSGISQKKLELYGCLLLRRWFQSSVSRHESELLSDDGQVSASKSKAGTILLLPPTDLREDDYHLQGKKWTKPKASSGTSSDPVVVAASTITTTVACNCERIDLDSLPYQQHHEPPRNAPAVILLHGLFGSLKNFRTFAKLLHTHVAVSVDLRNHGSSPHTDTMSYLEMAMDVNRLILEQGLQSAAVVGHSMGGKVAMATALLYPERVSHMVCLDMAPVDYQKEGGGLPQSATGYTTEEVVNLVAQLDISGVRSRREMDSLLHRVAPELSKSMRAFLVQSFSEQTTRPQQSQLHSESPCTSSCSAEEEEEATMTTTTTTWLQRKCPPEDKELRKDNDEVGHDDRSWGWDMNVPVIHKCLKEELFSWPFCTPDDDDDDDDNGNLVSNRFRAKTAPFCSPSLFVKAGRSMWVRPAYFDSIRKFFPNAVISTMESVGRNKTVCNLCSLCNDHLSSSSTLARLLLLLLVCGLAMLVCASTNNRLLLQINNMLLQTTNMYSLLCYSPLLVFLLLFFSSSYVFIYLSIYSFGLLLSVYLLLGHWLHAERPQDTAALINSFISKS